ncbi:MAG: FtsX-like permease family protein [Sphingobacteriales bacterium]|nr:FtsX-like permease family protein [Sphingobacteriales bacterium]
MLKIYLKTSIRYLWKHKGFSIINLIGLSIGIAVCYFALLYVNFELSYDRYNEKESQIYRIVTDEKTPFGVNYESAPAALGPALQAEFPEVKSSVRVFLDNYIIQKDKETYGTVDVAYADSSLFSVFSLPLASGRVNTLFNQPFDMVVSETAARRYFGTVQCIGKTLMLNGNQQAAVTGVMKDIPNNSHFKVDILLSMSSLIGKSDDSEWMKNWNRYGFYTYLLLPNKQAANSLSAKLNGFIKSHNPQSINQQTLSVEPLKEVYLKGKPRGNKAGSTTHGNINNMYIFSVIAGLVLFIACFNFINLTTAFSLQRAKEIGVRKVMGASKKQLISQFLADAMMLTLLAFIIALLVCVLLLPIFNQLSGKTISTSIFQNPAYIGLLLLITLIIGFLSGIYPAYLLSSFQPIESLKGQLVSGIKGIFLRKALVITQFSISIILIIATIFIYQQLSFMNQNLGFKKDHLLVIDFQYDDRIINHETKIKQKLLNIPGVDKASFASYIPGKPNKKFPTKIESVGHDMQEFIFDTYFIDTDFLQQYQIEIIAGRGFSSKHKSDLRTAMLINETAVKSLGFSNPKDALGKRFSQGTKGGEGIIIGVIKDFHFHSMAEKIQPLTLRISPGFFTYLTLSFSSNNVQSTIKNIEKAWNDLAPGLPLSYFFADEAYHAQYKSEERFGKLFISFSSLAILISCLGLFGLAAFSTTQRTKEIGVRKVLGASTASITSLLSKDFLKLISISIIIASPISWFAMSKWLQNFAYRVDITWWVFALAGILAILIAFITISFQTIKAAIANPVKSLRSE